MNEVDLDRVWQRALEGRHTAVIGCSPMPVTRAAAEMLLVRVTCEGPGSTWGPLVEARAKIAAFLEGAEDRSFERISSIAPATSPRARALGQLDGERSDERFVDACNRLADLELRPSALVIDGVDAADESTLLSLVRILRRDDWLRLPLVLAFRARPQAAAAVDLFDALRGRSGGDAVYVVAANEDASGDGAKRVGPGADASRGFDWSSLPTDVLRVLRAGAAIGSVFEVELVAALLQIDVGEVLDALQRAADRGAPIADAGEGRISLPPGAQAAVVAMTLPSMSTWWHRRLASLLGRDGVPAVNGARAHHVSLAGPSAEPPSPRKAPPGVVADGAREAPRTAAAGVVADRAREAQHLRAGRDLLAASERYLAAADEVSESGDSLRAAQLASSALEIVDGLPSSTARSTLRARALLHVGRARSDVGGEDSTLQTALATLEEARAALPPRGEPRLRAAIGAAMASVCYDVGDLASLQRALVELTDATRALLDAGEPQSAARLLNDEAAVHLRLGDPVRAMSLLERSRQVFEDFKRTHPDDVGATLELAETDHLIARVLLHARPREGRETDACALGIDYALAAERVYRAQGRQRDLGRVCETIARLETKRGRIERALDRASEAAELQSRIGDVTGLARTTGALADVLAARGDSERALTVLSESIALNVEKRSPIGLAFNRRAFDALSARILAGDASRQDGAAASAVHEVAQRLANAERRLGRLSLPGEGSSP